MKWRWAQSDKSRRGLKFLSQRNRPEGARHGLACNASHYATPAAGLTLSKVFLVALKSDSAISWLVPE